MESNWEADRIAKRLAKARQAVSHSLGAVTGAEHGEIGRLPEYLVRFATPDERGWSDRKPAGDFGDGSN